MTDAATASRPALPALLRVRRPEDLLALVPYLLGFRPTQSLVAVLIDQARVQLSARVDLPGPGAEAEAELVACVQQLIDRHRPEALVLIAYCTERERAEPFLVRQRHELTGVSIVDVLVVDGRRWWSLSCTGGCCPAQGTPVGSEAHPLAAAAVFAGLRALDHREDVAAQIAGPAPEAWAGTRAQADELAAPLRRLGHKQRRRRMATEVVAGLQDSAGADGDRLTRLALLAREVGARDVACALITRAQAQQHLLLWHRVVAQVPPELATAPLCLLGVAAWAAGEGALLNCCYERVLGLDPAYSMGQLLADVASRGLPPASWDALAAQLRRELGLSSG